MKLEKSSSYLLIKWLIVLVGFFSLHACKPKDQECYQNTVIMNYSRFLWRDSVKVYQAIDSFHGDSIYKPRFTDTPMIAPELVAIPYGSDSMYTTIGLKRDNILASPLDPDKDSIRYRFRTDTSTSAYFDTLTFFYEPVVHFINNACGYTYYYNLTNVKTTNHMLDSAAIITKNVSGTVPGGTGNVNFYFQKR